MTEEANSQSGARSSRDAIAIVVFGSAIGRFSIALRQLSAFQGHPLHRSGLSVWMGASSIVARVVLVLAGLLRYRKTRALLQVGEF